MINGWQRRRRWWCVLLPCDLPSFQLSVWPLTIEKPVISDVLEEWPQWPLEQERALAWSETESSLYSDPAYGSESRSLDWQAQAPAAMHSWGSALQPCPCGCRSAAFPDQTLRAKGLKGLGSFRRFFRVFGFLTPPRLVSLIPCLHPSSTSQKHEQRFVWRVR